VEPTLIISVIGILTALVLAWRVLERKDDDRG
jgi:hypothetical protein